MASESVTAAQIRAARAMLGLQQEELADKAKITRKTLAGVEKDGSQAFASTQKKVQLALEALGIQFLDNDSGTGILLRK